MRLDEKKLKRVAEVIDREIDGNKIPGATVAVGLGQETLYRYATGFAENMNDVVRPMGMDTIFDLASLTKVVATLPSVLYLIDQGDLRLNDPVARFIPSFADGNRSSVTVKHLLTHTSGLPAHRAFYNLYDTPEAMLAAAAETPLENEPWSTVVYSDIGFILLGEIIRTVSGLPIDQFAARHIFEPLGMRDTGYCPAPALQGRIAATENTGPGGTVKVGLVHDENALGLGGVAGHAGLFAPLEDLEKYIKMWAQPGPAVLSPAVRRAAVQCQTTKLDGFRGIGWTYRRDAYDHTGDMWPETTVAHTGFTGTSLALDPVSKLWAIFLTNDVHYGRQKTTIIRLRVLVHNVIMAAVADGW